MILPYGKFHGLNLSRLRLFFALSRTQHGLLDMATPPLCALLWLGAIPSLKVCLLGMITTFAGYTAVYALNDVIDYRSDKERLLKEKTPDAECLDDVLVRHPMAAGLMALRDGVLWVIAWSLIAVLGAYLLNPVCVIIFLGGCVLEIIYCLMLRVSYLRTLISGAVKTTGSVAAVFAVDPNPSLWLLTLLFLWLFFWEIGGQNVALDWVDMEEDSHLKAATIPVRFGTGTTGIVILVTILLSLSLGGFLFLQIHGGLKLPSVIASFLVGIYLLLIPAVRLYQTADRSFAVKLFNKASFYPPALLMVVAFNIWV